MSKPLTFKAPQTFLEAMEMATITLRENQQMQLTTSAVTMTCGTEGKQQRCEQHLPNSIKPVFTGSYEGHLIPFQADDAFVNATAMCAAFGKRPDDFFSHTAYLALQEPLADALNTRLVVTQNSGTSPSIWMHPELALVCAQWLSPDFRIWCNEIINHILLGELEVQSPFETSQTYSLTLQQVVEKTERLKRFNLQKQVVCEVIKKASLKLAGEIRELKLKAKKLDAWVKSSAHIPMNLACQALDQSDAPYSAEGIDLDTVAELIEPGLGRQGLIDWLRAEGILMPGPEVKPYQKYVDLGYFI